MMNAYGSDLKCAVNAVCGAVDRDSVQSHLWMAPETETGGSPHSRCTVLAGNYGSNRIVIGWDRIYKLRAIVVSTSELQ